MVCNPKVHQVLQTTSGLFVLMEEGHMSLNPGEPALAVLPRLVKETASFPENHWRGGAEKKSSN